LNEIRPIYSFESATDYILDCKWAPGNPAVFSAVDGSGAMDVWSLLCDFEVCIYLQSI
jgi:dynein intermediate chain